MEVYYIKFDRNNPDNLVISQDKVNGRIIKCPSSSNFTEVIDLSNFTSNEGHVLKFPNLMVITDQELRYLYNKDKLVDMIHRKSYNGK